MTTNPPRQHHDPNPPDDAVAPAPSPAPVPAPSPASVPAPSSASVSAAGQGRRPIRRALVSVYDKTGLADLARALGAAGVEIVSTGSTAQAIAAAGVAVTPVEELTGFPECLEGRVKTLHPKVHAGILADLRKPAHAEQLAQLGVKPFDLVVVNLYPFAATVASGAGADECVEQIDIGGPSMVRAAAKNHPSVAVVTAPDRYAEVAAALATGGFTLAQRRQLARDAFIHTADYDVAVATWMTSTLAPDQGLPPWHGTTCRRTHQLRYGENPHQAAAVYTEVSALSGTLGLAGAEQLGGKPMSFNNYGDADAARRAALDFAEPAVAIIKHANPCGIAVGGDIAEAHRKAHACDPLSAFGGVIAANRIVTVAMAEQIKPIFTEVIVAPGYEPAALELLQTKKGLRILRLAPDPLPALEFKAVSGGLLVQDRDAFQAPGDEPANWQLAAGPAADPATLADLAFAWRACRAVKSNAILLARDGASVGVGMGQVNRVDSAGLAVKRAGVDRAKGAVAASDAFFPFADGFEVLAQAGVKAVVEPGGSVRDQEVIAAAEAAGVSLYFTGSRHFFH
ncbi:MAG: bifunctional phosphoribosylaminoimidazolecarboxamide formyltransferase/IMP cyclohydrolase [Bifidobacteriaceae bacterium]|jgi:phosphoribosylaminoimidazolecarboxamide formyltransferase/IMP cyclohydrolase|nr:bifunctional phosphoribosylaminoimidazolecarboxamide formyltransferase/IMP cyclohydrolase [Bifidobacteriaceae bacterium]